jgi:Amidase
MTPMHRAQALSQFEPFFGQANVDRTPVVHRALVREIFVPARAAEAEIASGRQRGPLHGVPVGIKDIIDVAGLPTTCHSKLLIDNIASIDAVCVSRLRGAGAIVLGKLSTHEFAIGGPSFDLPWPPARNPWNTDHHPGGSSSGSGAGLAAGLFPMALGSDTGGSVRNPLDQRREITQHFDRGVAQPLVFLEMAGDKSELRTELARPPKCGSCPQPTSWRKAPGPSACCTPASYEARAFGVRGGMPGR